MKDDFRFIEDYLPIQAMQAGVGPRQLIHSNAIAEAFADLYDREVKRSLAGRAGNQAGGIDGWS